MNIARTKDGSAITCDQSSTGRSASISTKARWAGYVVNALMVLFLIFDGVIKALQFTPAMEATVGLGYPVHLVFGIGLIELACLALYVVPRTSVLGAIVLTGYLGAAVATHVRNGSDSFSLVFPIIASLLWGGLFVRNAQLRALMVNQA